MFESVLGVGEGGGTCTGVFQSIFSGIAVLVFMGVVLSEPCVLLNVVSITVGTCVCSLCYTFSLIQLKFSEHLVYVDEILYPMGGCDLGLTIDTLLLGGQTTWEKR